MPHTKKNYVVKTFTRKVMLPVEVTEEGMAAIVAATLTPRDGNRLFMDVEAHCDNEDIKANFSVQLEEAELQLCDFIMFYV